MTTGETEDVGSVSNLPVAQGPVGLGGWLILLMLHLLRGVYSYLEAVFVPSVRFPTDAGFPFQSLIQGTFAGLSLALLALMLRKSRWFPTSFIAFTLITMALKVILFGHLVGSDAIPVGFNRFTIMPLLGAVAPAAIWTPYMLKSRRVANTFVR